MSDDAMVIKSTTVYSVEAMMRFYRFMLKSKKSFWILMTVCTIVITLCEAFMIVLEGFPNDITFYTVSMYILFIMYLGIQVIVPKLRIKKEKNIDTVIEYGFSDEGFYRIVNNQYCSEQGFMNYSILTKVIHNGNDLYLFLNAELAYLVDISTLSSKELCVLKEWLSKAVPEKKIKW